jgi:hypothetical protein
VTNLDADKVDGLEASAFLRVDGSVSLSGGKIPFPATQVPSAGANDLDDYEEGTFTPTIAFGGGTTGITYTTQTGTYTKVGRKVSFFIRTVLSSKGSSVGAATITGLPFTSAGFEPCSVDPVTNLTGITSLPFAGLSGTTLTIIWINGAGTRTSITDTAFTNTTELRISGTYQV